MTLRHRTIIRFASAVLTSASLSLGCSDAGDAFPLPLDAAEANEPADAGTFGNAMPGAVYEVPVPDDLAPYAAYPVRVVRFDVSEGAVELRYPLPAELAGTEQRLRFRGAWSAAEQAYVLTGSDGDARCTVHGDEVVCLEHLVVRVDLAKVAERFGADHPRVEVARRFSVDPIGILRFRRAR